jgi:hypothetical protein
MQFFLYSGVKSANYGQSCSSDGPLSILTSCIIVDVADEKIRCKKKKKKTKTHGEICLRKAGTGNISIITLRNRARNVLREISMDLRNPSSVFWKNYLEQTRESVTASYVSQVAGKKERG